MIVFYLVFLISVGVEGIAASSNEDRLTVFLLNSTRYSPRFRPLLNHSDNIIVQHGLMLKMIVRVDEKRMVFSTNVRLRMKWKDALLQWNPADYGGVEQINLDASDLWTPPIILYNHADESADEDDEKKSSKPRAIIKHNGQVSWMVPTIIKSSCDIDIKYFPFDEQLCKLIFGSWNYDVTKLDIRSMEETVDITRYQPNGVWSMLSARVERAQVSHICCKTDVAHITYSIHIKRRKLFYTMNFILPCAIIAYLTLLVFLTPVDTGERMAVGVTILLSLAVFFLMLEATIPISEDLPLLGKYYCCTIIEVALCLGAMSWVLRFVHHSPEPLPDWIKRYILGSLARFVWYDTGTENASKKVTVKENPEDEEIDERRQAKFGLRWLKKVKERKTPLPSAESRAVMILAQNVKEQQETDQLQGQWELVAHVLNRFLICVFLLSVVVTILAVFVFDVPTFSF